MNPALRGRDDAADVGIGQHDDEARAHDGQELTLTDLERDVVQSGRLEIPRAVKLLDIFEFDHNALPFLGAV